LTTPPDQLTVLTTITFQVRSVADLIPARVAWRGLFSRATGSA
jgi:hypothetical protein